MEHTIRIGDRFRHRVDKALYEICDDRKDNIFYNGICIEVGDYSDKLGEIYRYPFLGYPDSWEFLGNFSKSCNFTSLYDILSM